jgi:hypothetical protein
MPSLNLKRVGMSYLVEGFQTSPLDAEQMLRSLEARFGPAVAKIGTARPTGDCVVEALIIDQKAETWERFKRVIESLINAQGMRVTGWCEQKDRNSACRVDFRA